MNKINPITSEELNEIKNELLESIDNFTLQCLSNKYKLDINPMAQSENLDMIKTRLIDLINDMANSPVDGDFITVIDYYSHFAIFVFKINSSIQYHTFVYNAMTTGIKRTAFVKYSSTFN